MRYGPSSSRLRHNDRGDRRAIQHSQESLRFLAKRYGINQKTVAKWKKHGSVADLPTGPREPKSTVLSVEDEAIVVAFRRPTSLPGWRPVSLIVAMVDDIPQPEVGR
jgi:hypothetical protein